MTSFFLVWLFLFICSCAVNKNQFESDIIISLKKTSCMGNCPVYTLRIYSDRIATLKGEENIPLIGTFFTRLTKNEILDLESKFEETGFFELEDEYKKNMTDLPTTYIFYSKAGRSKRIMDYYGAPPELKEMEKTVEMILETKRWRKTRNKE